jgi:hypothetical protein
VPLEIDHEKLLALCANALPRGTVEFGHRLIALREDSDGVRLTFQVPHAVRLSLKAASRNCLLVGLQKH